MSVAKSLDLAWDTSALSQVNRRLYTLLNRLVYRHYNVGYFSCSIPASILKWAAEHGKEGIAKKLLDEVPIRDIDYYMGGNLMLLAVKYGHEAIVRVLLDKGIGPDPSSRPRRQRPFYYAVRRGHVAVARMLLANETNGGCRCVDKLFTDAIVSAGSLPMVKFLVEEMRCDPKLEEAMSPFVLAAEHDRVDILQYLLELGLNVNTHDSNVTGNAVKTVLCYAAKKGQNNAVRFLIEHGADLNPMRGEEPITMLPLPGMGT